MVHILCVKVKHILVSSSDGGIHTKLCHAQLVNDSQLRSPHSLPTPLGRPHSLLLSISNLTWPLSQTKIGMRHCPDQAGTRSEVILGQ